MWCWCEYFIVTLFVSAHPISYFVDSLLFVSLSRARAHSPSASLARFLASSLSVPNVRTITQVRSHVLSHPDLKAQAATIMIERGVPPMLKAPIHNLTMPVTAASLAAHSSAGGDALKPPAPPKALSIWEETKYVTERSLVEQQERAYEVRSTPQEAAYQSTHTARFARV